MARLRVKHDGKLLQEIYLQEGQSYLAGRKDDCDIPLLAEKAISREHFKLFFQQGQWVLEVISRFGDVVFQGNKVQNLILDQTSVFRTPPYEFEFSLEHQQKLSIAEVNRSSVNDEDGEEHTFIGKLEQLPFIKLVNSQDKSEQLLRLDGGEIWLAGRDTSSSIPIKDPRVSRRQFEIRKLPSGYGIIDLGSVNGTLVNGNNISTTDVTLLRSGDAITVLNNTLYFELHDPKFAQRLQTIDYDKISRALVESTPVENSYPVVDPNVYGEDPYANQYVPQSFVPSQELTLKEKVLEKMKERRIQALVGGIIVVFILGIFMNSGESEKTSHGNGFADLKSNPNDPFNKLKKEQQILIKQSYQLAQNYFDNDNSELCRAELSKIREILPDYKKSYWAKDIESLDQSAEQKIYILLKLKEDEAKQKALQEQEVKIQEIAALCKSKLKQNLSRQDFDTCISPSVTLDPHHHLITALRAEFDQIDTQRTLREQQSKDQQDQAEKLRRLYSQAEKIEKDGDFVEAMEAYRKVINARLSDPGSLKSKAQRNLSSIKSKVGTKTSSLLQEAEKLAQAKNYKQAILNLRMAKKANPAAEEINEKIDAYIRDLRKEMKTLWEEAIIEESFGKVMPDPNNIGAVGKWKKIIELDISDGDFYQKAQVKLKKYGAN